MDDVNKYLQILKLHDYSTYLHSRRVASLSILIGEGVGLLEKEVNELLITALLHDIGKIKVPEVILNKDSLLNEDERKIIKNHPIFGVETIGDYFPQDVLNGVKSHHEFYNGNGYPDKLKGEEIPIYSRIIAIADAFDAMTNSRPYRNKPLSFDEAWGEIKIHTGTQFDPYIIKKLLNRNIYV